MKNIVSIDGVKIGINSINSEFSQNALKKLHLRGGKPRPKCLCKNEPVDICVCSGGKNYFLRKMPTTGEQHHPSCFFYSAPELFSGLKAYTSEAITITDEKISISANITIKKQSTNTEIVDSVTRIRKKGEIHDRQNRVTIMGIASVLWEQSGVYSWEPYFKERKWSVAYSKLKEIIDNTIVNRVKLSTNFYLVGWWYKDNKIDYKNFLANLIKIKKYGFVLGEVKKIYQSKYNYAVELKDLPSSSLYFATNVYENMTESYPNEIRAIENNNEALRDKVFGLFYIESKGKSATIHQAILFRTNKYFIPVSSSYELRLADYLIEQNRSFNKPMRYDAGKNTFFPDFILKDTGEQVYYCEVWGMTNNPDYTERMNKKIEYYNETDSLLWQWDAVHENEIPELPKSKSIGITK